PSLVRARASRLLALSVGRAGWAGADGTAVSADHPPTQAASTVAGPDVGSGVQVASLQATLPVQAKQADTIKLITPPRAREAVINARDAMQKKQWAALESLLPLAKSDPVLGTYAEYWSLRQKLQDRTRPVPDAEMQLFMQTHPDGYLADRLKGDWVIAATRAGNYQLAVKLGPVVNSNAQERCSRLLSLHMTGERVRAAQAMEAFQPNSACWSMLDQLADSKVVGWKELDALL